MLTYPPPPEEGVRGARAVQNEFLAPSSNTFPSFLDKRANSTTKVTLEGGTFR